MTTLKTGTIVSYDRARARGEVRWDDRTQSFGPGSFDGGRPKRRPHTGERVEVVLSENNSLLLIRLPRG